MDPIPEAKAPAAPAIASAAIASGEYPQWKIFLIALAGSMTVVLVVGLAAARVVGL